MNGTAALTDTTAAANARARILIGLVPSCSSLPEFGISGQ